MFNQFKVEWKKLGRFYIFYVVLLGMAILGFVFGNVKLARVTDTQEVLENVMGDTSFVFLISVITSWFVAGDFGNRTITNELKLGYSRESVFITRWLTIGIMATICHFLYVIGAVLGYVCASGWDTEFANYQNLIWVITIIFQLFALAAFITMICYLVRGLAAGIAVSVITIVILCNVLRNFFADTAWFQLSCFALVQKANSTFLVKSMGVALLTSVICLVIGVLCFRKKDIR